jgi:HAD superfamily hydrolase (TIGR01509 family)
MIRLFVFDLGNVILPFEHRQIVGKLLNKAKTTAGSSDDSAFSYMFDMENGLVNRYEEGLMSSFEFFTTIRDKYLLDITFDEFKDAWNPIFWDNPRVNEAIHYLKSKGFPVFLLSNTNELHFAHIIEKYPIVHVLDEWILSFEVGAKKPDKRIYDSIFERMDVDPGDVFYIDDIPRYVDAARSFGLQGMVFEDAEGLWKMIEKHGI